MVRTRFAIILSLWACALAGFARADVVVLKSGKTIRGEVLAERADFIRFRHPQDGEWVTIDLARSEIQSLYPEAGDQSDGVEIAGESHSDSERSSDGVSGPAAAAGAATLIARLPLHGPVGGIGAEGGFDAGLVQVCFEEAERRGARTIILDIDSPGGLVSEMEAICDLIIEWQDRLRIVAWPGEAYSAAAIITMCCPEIVVRPDSLIGAATIVEEGVDGMSALDAKMASPHYARQRQYMEKSGHPYEVVAAMTIQETRLWWSPQGDLTTEQPEPGGNWKEVDDARSILTMTATDARSWKIASETAATFEEVVAHLDHDDGDAGARTAILDLSPSAAAYQRELERGISNVQGHFETYFRGLASVNQAMIALLSAQQQRVPAEVETQRKAIVREIGRIRNAGRMIERVHRAGTQGRLSVPTEFLEQIASDGRTLSDVARALSQGDSASAGQLLGEVLAAWRTITGQE